MAKNIPIVQTDIYFSRQKKFHTIESAELTEPLAFNHISEAFEWLAANNQTQFVLIAQPFELMVELDKDFFTGLGALSKTEAGKRKSTSKLIG